MPKLLTIRLISFGLLLLSGMQVQAQYSTRYALLVGIGEYPKEGGWPKIHGDRDAERMAEVLKGYSFLPSNTMRLTNQRATREIILHSLNQLYQQAESGDIVYIHFAGHFQQITDLNGDETDRLDECFVTWDAQRFSNGKNAGKGLLSDDEISRSLAMLKEKLTRIGQLVLVTDGGLAEGPAARGTASPVQLTNPLKPNAGKKTPPRQNEWVDWEESSQNPYTIHIQPAKTELPVTEVAEKGDSLGPVTARILEVFRNPGKARSFADLAEQMENSRSRVPVNIKVSGSTDLECWSRGLSKRKEFTVQIPDVSDQPKDSRIFAICIGVSDYPGERKKLRFAHSDARSFYQLLQAAYGDKLVSDTSYLLLNEKATQSRIFQLLDRLRKEIKSGDRLYFYFAGHGDVEGSLINKPTFFLLPGGSEYSYSSGGHLPFDLLRNYISTFLFNGVQVFLLVDACRSGNLAGNADEPEDVSNGIQKIDRNQSVKILACRPNERSREGEEFGGGFGAFTWYLLRGLEGKADADGNREISLQEINHFLADSVASSTLNRQNPLVEGPEMISFLPRPKKFSARELARQKQAQKQAETNQVIRQLEMRFREQLKKNRLIEPADNCALFWLNKLEEAAEDQTEKKTRWREELSEAINNKTQKTINEYIAGNESIARESVFAQGAREISLFLDHNPSTHTLYAQMLARRYFFEAQAISPIAIYSDSDRRQLDSAINHLRTALHIEKKAAHLYNAIGRLYGRIGQFDSAIKNYNHAIQLAPRWKFLYNNIGAAHQEKMIGRNQLNKKACLDSAIWAFEQAIKLDGNYTVAIRNLGRLKYEAGDSVFAKKMYRKAIFLDGKDAVAYHLLAVSYKEEQNLDSAGLITNQGLRVAPENIDLNLDKADIVFQRAIRAHGSKKDSLLTESLSIIRKVRSILPDYPACLAGLFNTHFELGAFDSTVFYTEKYLQLNPLDTMTRLFLVDVLFRMNRNEEAAYKLSSLESLCHSIGLYQVLWFQYYIRKKDFVRGSISYKKAIAAGISGQEFQSLDEWVPFRKSKEYLKLAKAEKK